jgi:ribosome assembly protein YihI (activator of Der GTPase)
LCVIGVKNEKEIKKTLNKNKKNKKRPKIGSHMSIAFFIFEPSNWTPSL